MGNRLSNSSASSASSEGQGQGQGQGQEGEGGSGLYLTPELQAQINSDFESHLIQAEWDKYRRLHLQRHEQREASAALREEEIEQQMEALRSQAAAVHSKLDDAIDAAKSMLVDLEVEVGHDAGRLGARFEGGPSAATPGGRCLDVRADVSHCYNTLKDRGECRVFVQRLEQCVTEALKSS